MSFLWQLIALISRLFVAGVFLLASYDKVWEPAAFAQMTALYDMLPLQIVNAASVTLAWLEFTIGCFLLVGWRTTPSAAWAVGLLIFFTGLMIYAGFTIPFHPLIESVVQEEIGQQRTDDPSLRRSPVTTPKLTLRGLHRGF
jgi:uncharacterized membrane protein YphA (DoxX/SURF4 family)